MAGPIDRKKAGRPKAKPTKRRGSVRKPGRGTRSKGLPTRAGQQSRGTSERSLRPLGLAAAPPMPAGSTGLGVLTAVSTKGTSEPSQGAAKLGSTEPTGTSASTAPAPAPTEPTSLEAAEAWIARLKRNEPRANPKDATYPERRAAWEEAMRIAQEQKSQASGGGKS